LEGVSCWHRNSRWRTHRYSAFSIFAGALTINLIRGLDIACGCFSTAANGGSISGFYLLRDFSLLLMSIQILFFDRTLFSVTRLRKK